MLRRCFLFFFPPAGLRGVGYFFVSLEQAQTYTIHNMWVPSSPRTAGSYVGQRPLPFPTGSCHVISRTSCFHTWLTCIPSDRIQRPYFLFELFFLPVFLLTCAGGSRSTFLGNDAVRYPATLRMSSLSLWALLPGTLGRPI